MYTGLSRPAEVEGREVEQGQWLYSAGNLGVRIRGKQIL